MVRSLVIALALAAVAPASAQSPNAASGSARPPHQLIGTIARIDGDVLVLHLRTGRDQRIDAAPALRSDNYSAPLFVGKAVAVEGSFDARGTFTASSIAKVAKSDESAPLDR